MGDHRGGEDVVVVAEGHHGLRLHGAHRVGDHQAQRVEGVGAEPRLDPVHRGRRALHLVEVLRHAARRPVVDAQATRGRVAAVGVVADGQRDEVRRRRLGELPRRGGAVLVGGELGEVAVGDAGPRRGRVHGHVVERLVGRLVVDRVPRVGAVGLLHRPHLAGLGDREAGGGEVAARRRRWCGPRGAGVVDAEPVALVGDDRGPDHEVLAASDDVDLLAVEGDLADVELATEVELEAGRPARGAEVDDRLSGQLPLRRVPGEVEVVEQRVDARVADVGVDAVLDRRGERQVEVLLDRLGDRGRRAGREDVLGRPAGARRGRGLLEPLVGTLLGRAPREEDQHGRRTEPGAQRTRPSGQGHLSPRSSGRASLRPWWICAFTVPSGASTSSAISS